MGKLNHELFKVNIGFSIVVYMKMFYRYSVDFEHVFLD